jgi:ABC-type phosphate transport system substrate-binding protein
MKRAIPIGLFLLLATVAAAETPVQFVVIVNSENPAASARRSTVSALFLKRAEKWQNGLESHPVDLIETSKTREVFSRQILGRPIYEVEQFWQTAIFSGRDLPPPKKVTEDEVVAFVARYPGAIGYVSRTTPLVSGVKVLHLLGE